MKKNPQAENKNKQNTSKPSNKKERGGKNGISQNQGETKGSFCPLHFCVIINCIMNLRWEHICNQSFCQNGAKAGSQGCDF